MPSDERTPLALAATADLRARYRSAVAAAAEQVATWLGAHRSEAGDVAAAMLAELGAFAIGRIDAARLASLTGSPRAVSPDIAARAQEVEVVLQDLLARGDALFAIELPPGEDLRLAVHDALARAGRAFGAALVFQSLKSDVHLPAQHDPLLESFPYARWNRSERLLAPPLVITLDGADLQGDALAEFLDGQQKIVLVVRGPVTPAPLVRLVTPGTFVAQATEVRDVERAVAFAGPAIVALVPESAARFVHDPAAGGSLRERLTVGWLPREAPRTPIAGRSAAQQREELAQLATLAELVASPSPSPPPMLDAAPAAVVAASASAAALAPAALPAPALDAPVAPDKAVSALAAWLLSEAGFPGGVSTR